MYNFTFKTKKLAQYRAAFSDKMLSGKFSRRRENVLFIKRLLKNPKALGALVPSSRKLAAFMCRHVECHEGEYILEVGAGTGRFTQALIESGVNPAQLIVIELDTELAQYLKQRFPTICVVQGSAAELMGILPTGVAGNIRTIVSGIPMVNLSKTMQKDIIDSCFSVARPNAHLLQFTYSPVAPFSAKEFNLQSCRIGSVFLNFPPAGIWRFWV